MSTFPFEYEDLDEETNASIKRDFKSCTKGLMLVKPFNFCMPPEFKNYGEKIYNMEVRPDDVWLVSFPKTGTTWSAAAIWSILNDGRLELLEDNPKLLNWTFLEMDAISKDLKDRLVAEGLLLSDTMDSVEKAIQAPRNKRRLIKTHLPFPLLPPNLLDTAKVIYVVRNPRDVCVSFFYHQIDMLMYGFEGDFKLFFDYFIKDLLMYSPYWPHVNDGWSRRSHPNMLLLFYEDMKKDFGGALRKLANFLEKTISEEVVEKLLTELSIDKMRKNPALNEDFLKNVGMMKKEGSFFRKGIVGDWKNHFTPEMENQMNEWSKRQRKGSEIKFPGEE